MTEFVVAFDTNKSSQVGIVGIEIGKYSLVQCIYINVRVLSQRDVRQVVLVKYRVHL